MTTEFTVDEGRREVYLNGRRIQLTRTEFDLIAALIERPGLSLSSAELLAGIRGPYWGTSVSVLHVLVSRLRKKLGESGGRPRFILTVRGYGYRFEGVPKKQRAGDPRAFVADEAADKGPSPRAREVTLRMDHLLKLRELDPQLPFLGWDPESILGTFFSPTGLDEASMRTLIDLHLAAGTLALGGPVALQARDGTVHSAEVAATILQSTLGTFEGMNFTVRL